MSVEHPWPSPGRRPTARSALSAAAHAVERRSVDWVPHEERHGRVSDLGSMWFASNVNLTAMATGVTALSVGAPLAWTMVASTLGSLFGTFFMAVHSAQGPHLGLPQLVQSRPQFGYLGASLTVWVFALVNYLAYNTSDAILAGSAVHGVFGVPTTVGYLASAVVASVVAFFGHDWIHRVNRWLTWPMIALLVVLSVAAATNEAVPPLTLAGFEPAPVMTVFVITAGFQLGWAPYVSDYSRYLASDVPARSAFWWTYLPSALSAVWVFVLGAAMAAASPGAEPVTAFAAAADTLADGFGRVAIAALLLGLLSVMSVNQYGGALTMIAIRDSFRPVRPTRRARALAVGAMFAVVWLVSHTVGAERFTAFYGNILIFLAYLFTPWTAVNLVDYFLVRRGCYVISAIFDPDGVYGRWGWRGNAAYLLGLAAMVPFMVTTPYTGPAAALLGGVDCSVLVGLPISGGAYWVLTRSLDLERERRLARDEGVLDPR
ncbi:Purine-cytosine permease [Streptoalloteichus tenebrarius]|uniref:Purine-cytosine permease n=1 Tax=Streptoalloteichus tenebrarius (strain ATCC 17920 / DSM 40477 / JCM 4838 / CBS 697.72 / NBRC 16177 / NCIMB 11028 / NRRL B-12390 / A12253. 1 / ISP 5477) TaxID=1933 RepID=A0ABT1I2Z7_STRSD|nr:cytosine permease [Streptoalloteichus tenebrarius]MCP2262156.1 Purine-cytosine permease [Streptoalloteichus tenebrarius]BFF00041.1 cytosine permease [Streptoalloteichus tenebrarius]